MDELGHELAFWLRWIRRLIVWGGGICVWAIIAAFINEGIGSKDGAILYLIASTGSLIGYVLWRVGKKLNLPDGDPPSAHRAPRQPEQPQITLLPPVRTQAEVIALLYGPAGPPRR